MRSALILTAQQTDPSQNKSSTKQKLTAVALRQYLKHQFQYRKEQAQFGFGTLQRDELLKEVHECNQKLEELLQKSFRVATFETSKTTAVSPKAVRSLVRYAHQADRIYALMHHSWGCQCKAKHCAYLWLQHRTSPDFELKLLVLWDPVSPLGSDLPPWDRQGLQIVSSTSRLSKIKSLRIDSVVDKPLAVPVPSLAGSRGPKKRKVEFAGIR